MVSLADAISIVSIIVAAAALIISIVEIRRQRSDREISKASLDLIKTMHEELKRIQQPSPARSPNALPDSELRKREALEWKKLRDVAKAVGWVWDRLGENDD